MLFIMQHTVAEDAGEYCENIIALSTWPRIVKKEKKSSTSYRIRANKTSPRKTQAPRRAQLTVPH